MWVFVDLLGGTVVDASLAAAVLSGLTALAMVGCRQPARRCSLARAGILGSLALLPLVALGPSRRQVEVVGLARSILTPPTISRPERLEGPGAAVAQPGWTAPATGPWVARVLTLFYLAGASASLAWLVLGWCFSCSLIRRSAEPSAATGAFYEALPYAGSMRRPGLRVATRGRRPVLLGMIRPTILIPPDLDRPEARDRLRLSLLHELAHAEHMDPWFRLVGGLAQAAWFFLPWVWWIQRQMRLDQEFLADHCAASVFGTAGNYASSLVELADSGPTGRVAVPTGRTCPATPWGVGSALFQRVLMLMRCPYSVEAQAPRWWRWSLPPVVVCCVLLASSLTLRSAESSAARGTGGPIGPLAQRSFQMTRLVIPETPGGPDGWTRPHDLPLTLPERFDLSLEILAEVDDLPRTRIVGYRLGEPRAAELPGSAPPAPAPLTWHRVHIRRDSRGICIGVDGLPVPVDPRDGPTSVWLSVQPAPDRPGLFRNINLSW